MNRMTEMTRVRVATWLAPAFLIALGALFILAPWSLKEKLDAVGYGI